LARLETLASITAANILIPAGPQARYHEIVEEAGASLGQVETVVDMLREQLEDEHRRLDEARDAALKATTEEEETGMSTFPDSVAYGFNAIRVISTQEWLQEDIEAFQERWGDVDLLTFARVLQQAQGDDQMVAAFAIGHTRSAWARDLLLPFLQSDDPGVRWAAALSLGDMKDERARPVLVQMLHEFLPPPYTLLGEVGPDWFEVEHLRVAHLLGRWGDPALIPALAETLVRVWQVEREAPEHINQAGTQLRWDYQDELAYALGQLGAFDALTDLEVPAHRSRVWTVNLAMGYLNVQERSRTNCLGFLGDPLHIEASQDLFPLLLQVLQQQLGLSPQEATAYVQGYGHDYFRRFDDQAGG
jgi:HEAT repeats